MKAALLQGILNFFSNSAFAGVVAMVYYSITGNLDIAWAVGILLLFLTQEK